MELNRKSLSIFFFIMIILYPLIYYFAEKKISKSNLDLYENNYEIEGIITFKGIDQIQKKMIDLTKKLNDKYFDQKGLIYFPDDGFFVLEPNSNTFVRTNKSYSLYLDGKEIFYINKDSLFSYLKDQIHTINFKEDNPINCQNIIYKKKKSLLNIDESSFYMDFVIQEKLFRKITNDEEIFYNYKICFQDRLKLINFRFTEFLETIYNLQSIMLEKNVDTFVLNNTSLFLKNNAENFKREVMHLQKNLFFNLKNVKLEVNYINIPKIDKIKKLQKKFNLYVISFILDIMISLILLYLLFFTKNYLKFLKKIF